MAVCQYGRPACLPCERAPERSDDSCIPQSEVPPGPREEKTTTDGLSLRAGPHLDARTPGRLTFMTTCACACGRSSTPYTPPSPPPPASLHTGRKEGGHIQDLHTHTQSLMPPLLPGLQASAHQHATRARHPSCPPPTHPTHTPPLPAGLCPPACGACRPHPAWQVLPPVHRVVLQEGPAGADLPRDPALKPGQRGATAQEAGHR